MIVPITLSAGGTTQNVGTAQVETIDGEIIVTFYLVAGFTMPTGVKADIEKQLKASARKRDV